MLAPTATVCAALPAPMRTLSNPSAPLLPAPAPPPRPAAAPATLGGAAAPPRPTRAVVSCLRCDEPSVSGGLPRCGCFVRVLRYNLPHTVVSLLDGAPRRVRRLRGLRGRHARERGVLPRDCAGRPHPPPAWFAAAHAPPAYDVGRPMHLPVYIDANANRTRAAASRTALPPPAEAAAAAAARAPAAAAAAAPPPLPDELVAARRTFRRACVLDVPPCATLADVKAALREQYGVEGARCAKLSGSHARLLVPLHRGQDGCAAHPVFAGGEDPLLVW